MLYGTVVNFAILWQCRRQVHLGRIWPLVAAGLLGLPVGVLALERLDVRAAQLLVGAVVTAAAAAMLAGMRRKVRRERRAMVPVGLASGFLNATTAASGPPVVLFLANQAAPRMVFRANLAAYFTALNVVNLALFAARGILTAEVGRLALVWAPAAAVGAAAGLAASRHLREQLFRRIVLGLTVLAGLVAIATGLGLFDALGDGT
jgi:uncharacterized membrane protein YfcA